MAEKRDYYEVLGLAKSATKDEIKSAYRKLAKKYHPDNKETGDEAKFKEVQEAYDVLYDDQKRSTYDQFGFSAFEQAGGNPGGNPFEGFSGGMGDIFSDVMSSFFGGGSRRAQRDFGPKKGDDRLLRIKVDFMDTITGKDVSVPLTFDAECPHCHGSGAETPNDVETCSQCHGTGVIRSQRRTIFGGVVETQDVCPRCGGSGKTVKTKCSQCRGEGYIRTKIDQPIHIPAGISEGQQIFVSGKGGRGYNGGKNGDLYVEVAVKPHPLFVRQGNDIHINQDIDVVDAMLGKEMVVKTVYGDVKLTVPEGTQPNTTLKMKEKGVKDLRTGRPGDQYVHLNIKIPTKLSSHQKDLLREFADKEQEKSDKKSIFKKLKK